METSTSAIDAIDPDTIKRWTTLAITTGEPGDGPNSASEGETLRGFAVDTGINDRIALWNGQLWRLGADAIVNPTTENLQDSTGICRKILDAAGREIWTECNSVGPCRTGEAVVTRGCRLPAKKIIHTVGPRYNVKYHNAAEHALHMCYRSVLSTAIEQRLTSVAFPCVYSKRKGYPRDEAAHIAARTVRRFLEHYPQTSMRLVVFCVETIEDQLIYEAVLPLYFPRTATEREASISALCLRDLGDKHGEPIIPERQIRIGAIGKGGSMSSASTDQQNESDDDLTDDEDAALQSFCEMVADPDEQRLEKLQQLQAERQRQAAKAQQVKIATINYQAVLAKAQREDFTDLQELRFLYRAGVDHSGAPIIVYMIMDAIVDKQYSVLYIPSDGTSENQPNASWIKRLFKTFATKYQRNLRFFYVFEPTTWMKLVVFVAKGFVSREFYRKIVYIASSKQLMNVAASLDLPHHIFPPRQEPEPAQNSDEEAVTKRPEDNEGFAWVVARKAPTEAVL